MVPLTVFFFLSALPVCAEEAPFDASSVALKSLNRYTGYDQTTVMEMRLINAKGEMRRRKFLRYQIVEDEQRKNLDGFLSPTKTTSTKFLYPKDIRNTGTLNIEVEGKDDTQYLYLPAAKKLRRMSAKSQSWVGSDFSYEDLQEIEHSDFTYAAIGFGEHDGFECYVYSMTPVTTDKSIYSKQIRWARKDPYYKNMAVKIEYYDKKGELLKILEFFDVDEIEEGTFFPKKWVVQNVQDGHRTELTRKWIQLNSDIPPALLTTRHLKKSVEFYDHPEGIWESLKKVSSE